MHESDRFRIDDARWAQGWRHEFRAAVDKALEPYSDGDEVQIEEIWVVKREDKSFHDYRVVVRPPG
jgi:hypothetical protein